MTMDTTTAAMVPTLLRNVLKDVNLQIVDDYVLDIVHYGNKESVPPTNPTAPAAGSACAFSAIIINQSSVPFRYVGVDFDGSDGWVQRPADNIVKAGGGTISYGGNSAMNVSGILTLSAVWAGQPASIETLVTVPMFSSNIFRITFKPTSSFVAALSGNKMGWEPAVTWKIYDS